MFGLTFGPGLYDLKKEEIKTTILTHLNYVAESPGLIENSSIQTKLFGKHVTYTAYLGFMGVPCTNVIITNKYNK